MKRRPKALAPRAPRLFGEMDRGAEARAADAHVAYVDGASRGNPGPAAYGVVIRRPDGRIVFELGKYLGQTTNNVAEYFALMTALDYAASHAIAKLRVRSDSELLVRQMQGHYKVRSSTLRPLHEQARRLASSLAYFSLEHVPREQNREADRLANQALDRAEGKSTAESMAAKSERRTVRARWSHGALHPAEPLDLDEGAEVEITIHPRRRT
jgi:probable phosphoglycerate mutase